MRSSAAAVASVLDFKPTSNDWQFATVADKIRAMVAHPAQNPDNPNQLNKRMLVVFLGLTLLMAIGNIAEAKTRGQFGPAYVRYVDAVGAFLMIAWVWGFAIMDRVRRQGWAGPIAMIGGVAFCTTILIYEIVSRGRLSVWASGLQGGFGAVGLTLSTTLAFRQEREKSGDNHRGLRLGLSLIVIAGCLWLLIAATIRSHRSKSAPAFPSGMTSPQH